MRVRIGCVDGHTYESDYVPAADIQEYLDEVDGVIGNDPKNGPIVVRNEREFGAWFIDMCKYDTSNNAQSITLEIEGVTRMFNSAHIVWAEVILDTKE